MGSTVLLEKQQENFIRFPEKIQAYFLDKEIVIYIYPTDIINEQENNPTFFKVTSADQFYDYLDNEIDFWDKNDSGNKLESIVRQSRFKTAKNHFNNAVTYVNSPGSMENYLRQSIGILRDGALSSKTCLATELLKYVDESSYFITGFRAGMLINSTSSISTYPEVFRGFYAAMAYRNIFKNYALSAEEKIVEFKTNIEEANNNYYSLNANYTKSFLEQEKRLQSIESQTNSHFDNFFNKENSFFADASMRLSILEKQYQENLKLKAPAQYWQEMENDYIKKGRFWLIISAVISVVTIGLLIVLLIFAPDVFSKDNHWFETVKNSAIITVITSICIYVLRTTVKMAMSSFHLSRDAKERNKLSVFYLSLIEDDAVTDKERAIILNALFSRSDTGLLKGDSAPSMPSNISDIIEIVKSAKP